MKVGQVKASLVQRQYDRWSEDYDQCINLTRDLDETMTGLHLGGQVFDFILEIGCGTGKNTKLFASIADQVHSMDFSEGMLQRAKSNLSSRNVRFTQADFNRIWPTESDTYDLAACNLVLEHIQDLSHIFHEANRSLKVGGQFYISELHPFRQYTGTAANFQSGDEIEKIPAYVHDVSEYLSVAKSHGFELEYLDEPKHKDDQKIYPRLLIFSFTKTADLFRF